jgi:hypothetical protein
MSDTRTLTGVLLKSQLLVQNSLGQASASRTVSKESLNFLWAQKIASCIFHEQDPTRGLSNLPPKLPLFYTTVERRGWLVPVSAVSAHIAQTRHSREGFITNEKLVHIDPTDPKLGVYEAAEKMLWDNSSVALGEKQATRTSTSEIW